ncbi:hypothetical protein C5167_034514 [Papaver somniferum]|uniref:Uncharacterized protein n=1 Tax=Papaver somniferum TaxID=3469 RepID=A0A4Y7KES1_PAPSO|nr:hypothetical protein C5167_034514 [Papaver somniferum]
MTTSADHNHISDHHQQNHPIVDKQNPSQPYNFIPPEFILDNNQIFTLPDQEQIIFFHDIASPCLQFSISVQSLHISFIYIFLIIHLVQFMHSHSSNLQSIGRSFHFQLHLPFCNSLTTASLTDSNSNITCLAPAPESPPLPSISYGSQHQMPPTDPSLLLSMTSTYIAPNKVTNKFFSTPTISNIPSNQHSHIHSNSDSFSFSSQAPLQLHSPAVTAPSHFHCRLKSQLTVTKNTLLLSFHNP